MPRQKKTSLQAVNSNHVLMEKLVQTIKTDLEIKVIEIVSNLKSVSNDWTDKAFQDSFFDTVLHMVTSRVDKSPNKRVCDFSRSVRVNYDDEKDISENKIRMKIDLFVSEDAVKVVKKIADRLTIGSPSKEIYSHKCKGFFQGLMVEEFIFDTEHTHETQEQRSKEIAELFHSFSHELKDKSRAGVVDRKKQTLHVEFVPKLGEEEPGNSIVIDFSMSEWPSICFSHYLVNLTRSDEFSVPTVTVEVVPKKSSPQADLHGASTSQPTSWQYQRR